MLGREVNVPAQLMFPNVQDKCVDTEEYVCQLTENMKKAHQIARETLKTSSKKMKRNYDLKILLRPYKEGDVVYLMDTAVLKGKCRKLCSPWKGPAVITKQISAYLYRVKLRNAVFVVNHDRMMPCRDRKLPAWVVQFKANAAQEESDNEEDEGKLYCMCQKPWEGRFMIQCDYCDIWYHGSCVNVSASDALDIDKYKCRPCKSTRSRR